MRYIDLVVMTKKDNLGKKDYFRVDRLLSRFYYWEDDVLRYLSKEDIVSEKVIGVVYVKEMELFRFNRDYINLYNFSDAEEKAYFLTVDWYYAQNANLEGLSFEDFSHRMLKTLHDIKDIDKFNENKEKKEVFASSDIKSCVESGNFDLVEGTMLHRIFNSYGLENVQEVIKAWNDPHDVYKVKVGFKGNLHIKCISCGRDVIKFERFMVNGKCKECNTLVGNPEKYGILEVSDEVKRSYASCDNDIPIGKLGRLSRKVVTLRCSRCGNEYKIIAKDIKSSLCRPCSRYMSMLERGLSVADLEYADEFNEEKNGVSSSKVLANDTINYWWTCPNGHSYKASPHSRKVTPAKNNCPYCNSTDKFYETCIEKYGSVATMEYASEFDEERNGILASNVFKNSRDEYWWRCSSKGHSFKISPRKRNHSNDSCPVCSGREVLQGYNDLATVYPGLVQYWVDKNKKLTEVTKNSSYIARWVCPLCGDEYDLRVDDRVHGIRCPNCTEVFRSASEIELSEYVKSLGFPVVDNYRMIGEINYEIDIYIPEKKIGFEYNGVYYHNDSMKSPEYHKSKYNEAINNGITLYTIWEDTYNDRKDLVHKFISRKLGVSKEERLGARECTICEEKKSLEIDNFLQKNHMRGKVNVYSFAITLRKGDRLCGVALFTRNNDIKCTLVRYATSCMLRGGLSRIISYLKKSHQFTTLITYSDNMVSDGSLYELLGFKKAYELPEDYSYVVRGKRVHKFNYRKNRFFEDSDLTYVEGMTEYELAELNGLKRVWDAGKVRWELDLK